MASEPLRRAFVAITLLLAAAPAAAATDMDCVRGEAEPVLHADAAALVAHTFERTSEREAVERARLTDGLSITIHHGGCAHYGLRIELRPAASDAQAPNLHRQARALMRRLVEADPSFDAGDRFMAASRKAVEEIGESIDLVDVPGYSRFYIEWLARQSSPGAVMVIFDVTL